MGEPELFSSSTPNPVYIVIMRNSRGKLFVYVAVLGVLCFIVFLLSSTHTSLKELESVNEKCQQQRDSLSAQLQVVYEHKNRLEKSLQQEKTDHRHTKEENEKQLHLLESKLQEEKEKIQKLEVQATQLKSSYSELEEEKAQSENALTEQLKTVQSQKDKEIEKLQNHISELLTEKDKLDMSNNAKIWKVEQLMSELNIFHLQQNQTKSELMKCQEQLLKNVQNTEDGHLLPKIITSVKKTIGDNRVKQVSDLPQPHIQDNIKDGVKEQPENKSTSQPPSEKKVLSKPHILPANNAADGVLAKPLEDKIDDVDAAVEVPEVKKGEHDAKLLHINPRDIDNKINVMHDEKKENLDMALKADAARKELENHPQVLPPNNFDIGDKDDHAAERGEYGPQYGLPDARQQVEIPVFNSKHNAKRKNLMPLPQQMNSNDIAAQMQDMMNKSPGDVNNFEDQNGLHVPPHAFGAIDDKIREFRNADGLLQRVGDANNVMDDKNYEEDDDDRENDDDQVNGVAHDMKGPPVLPDNDFDDQDNQENVDNAKEGVVVAPK